MNRGAWVHAEELQPGDQVLDAQGEIGIVDSVDVYQVKTQQVHNLTIDDIHTYYVVQGEEAVLSHNVCAEMVSYGSTDLSAYARDLRMLSDNPLSGKNLAVARLKSGEIVTGVSRRGVHAEEDIVFQLSQRNLLGEVDELYSEFAFCDRCAGLLDMLGARRYTASIEFAGPGHPANRANQLEALVKGGVIG